MAKDDSSGGFLSKVVKFVRHPTTSWADLDTRQADRESEYSKAALKEMIERKRRNDFVRKREFDMLRKIRSREGTPAEAQGMRPSFFQSSLPSKPDDRAMTLKKIDEIEAQMSMQWWKTKGADSINSTGSGLNPAAQAASAQKAADASAARPPMVDPARLKAQYDVTEPAPLLNPMAQGARAGAPAAKAPAPPSKPASTARTGLMAPRSGGAASSGHGSSFSASHFYALDVQEVAQDPEVEEAAIRFANGDDAGAEQGLLDALADNGPRVEQEPDWLALFDLYRATGQLAAFESRAVDFVNRFDRSAPQWYDMPAEVARMVGRTDEPLASGQARAVWVAEAELDAHAIGTLQNVLSRARQPWVIDWSPLAVMDPKAARALLGLVTLWTDQDVDLRFAGGAKLRDLLKGMTPSGRRDVEQLWWELRMAVLRLMNRVDEFELTALDFCVTYELSPPGWERPRCRYQSMHGDGSDDGLQSVLGESVMEAVPSTLSGESIIDSSPTGGLNHLGLVELSGEIRGDAQNTVDMLEQRLAGADVLILSCRNLIRVDFSAAGTLLNWVTNHHNNGRLVQFVDVHRLVSAFFHVVGITEYAKVVLRND
jgi:anti-anti-sigma regulatory factor